MHERPCPRSTREEQMAPASGLFALATRWPVARSWRSGCWRLGQAGFAVLMATSAVIAVAAAGEPAPAASPPGAATNLASVIASVDIPAGMRRAPAWGTDVHLSAGNPGPKLFFGFLEFDQ